MITITEPERDHSGARTHSRPPVTLRTVRQPTSRTRTEPDNSEIRWIDVDVAALNLDRAPVREQTADALLAAIGSETDGQLDRCMLIDLLEVADRRLGERYSEGRIRSASSFRVETTRVLRRDERERDAVSGQLHVQPVEFLSNERWLITCWHGSRTFHGDQEVPTDGAPQPHDEIVRAAISRWEQGPGGTAGDLGVLVLHELALSYAPAYRAVRGWVEEWEIGLYRGEDADEHRLRELWASMAQLREWMTPLNPPGVRTSLDRAWFAAVENHDEVKRVDDRIDRALHGLREVADTIRASFALVHAEKLERSRRNQERFQRRLELLAAGFLVPTLIVGFYGVNTKLPGQQTWWGFWMMVALIVLLTSVTVVAVVYVGRAQRADATRSPRG
jgi:Mg2+ and Co2+ transporter CorA